MKLYVANKETGDFIKEVNSIHEGRVIIEQYAIDDEYECVDTAYLFYDIVDENHISMMNAKEYFSVAWFNDDEYVEQYNVESCAMLRSGRLLIRSWVKQENNIYEEVVDIIDPAIYKIRVHMDDIHVLGKMEESEV